MLRTAARTFACAALIGLSAAYGAAAASAQTVDFATFSSADLGAGANQITLNGDAALNGSALRLTPNTFFQRGSAFYNTRLLVAGGFVADFRYFIGDGNEGDGLAFLVSDDAAGATALGSNGGGRGFLGLGPDVLALAYDTYTEISFRLRDGAGAVLSDEGRPNFGFGDIRGTQDVRVEFLSSGLVGTLNVYQANPALPFFSISGFDMSPYADEAGTAFIGFSAGTGQNTDAHDIRRFSFRSTALSAAAPEPTTLAFVLAGIIPLARAVARRRRASAGLRRR